MTTSFTYPSGDHFKHIPDAKLMWVKFTAIPPTGLWNSQAASFSSVTLYMPPNFTVNDSGQYNNFDLGLGLGGFSEIIGAFKDEDASALSTAFGGIVHGLGNIPTLLTNLRPSDSKVRALQANLSRKVVNPHTITNFSKVNIRKFNFSFRMIATSENEAEEIKNMTEFVRTCVYPTNAKYNTTDASGMIQKFPPTWKIEFLYGSLDSLAENDKLPVIHECFLESCQTTYNSESNAWHADGHPVDVSVTLSFSETKPYDSETINSRSTSLDPVVNSQLTAVQNSISSGNVTEDLLDEISRNLDEAEIVSSTNKEAYGAAKEQYDNGDIDESELATFYNKMQDSSELYSTLVYQQAEANEMFLKQADQT